MAYNPNNPNGQATMANSEPVVIASDQSAVPVSDNGSTLSVDDGGSSLTVDGTVTANAGTGNFTVVQSTAANLNATVTGTVTANAGTGTMNVSVQNASIPVTDNGGSLTVDGTVTANAGTGTFAVSATSLPLPTGAATEAKQPAIGTAGTPSADVITVQGAASMTALKVDGSAVTQPVSGTVTANAGTGSFTVAQATAANLNATVVGSGNFTVVQPTASNLNVTADTELPSAAALADGASNPTTPTVGAAALGFNGSTWDRLETATVFDGNGATDYTGVLAVKQVPKRVNPTALGTATNSASTVDVSGSSNVTVAISTTTTGTFVIEGTADNTNWGNVECFDVFADVWVSGTSITPTAGKVYSILSGGMRQIRIRTNATLGATVTHYFVLDKTQEFIAAIDTGAAPHNFGYALIHKDGEYSTQQTTTALWTPATGKRFVITDLTISTGSTTSGIVTVYDAAASTAYSVGTTPAIFRGEFAPSANAKPGVVKSFNVPYYSAAVNNRVHITTSAAMTVYIQVNGYEI